MNMQQIRSRLNSRIHRFHRRVQIGAWDCLAALQSSTALESSFKLWTSPAYVSRRAPDFPLKPYLCQLQRNVLIEPRFGFAIADYGLLIETSVSNGYAARDPVLWQVGGLPSPARYFESRILGRHCTDLESVISLGTRWCSNYFHFYRDFLPKMLLLEEADIDPALPVIVEDRLFDQPFFREAIQSKRLSRWNFMSPRGQFIKTKSVVFCSANQFFLHDRSVAPESELFRRASAGTKFLESPEEVLALLDLDDRGLKTTPERRIFLTRSARRGRNLSNYEEIETLLSDWSFETVDTEGMPLRDQSQLFLESRYVIGIHGAGLTNIIHAHDHDLSLLELRPPAEEHLITDFAQMCHSFGFTYQEIFGASEHGGRDASFRIDVAVLRAAITRMLTPHLSDLSRKSTTRRASTGGTSSSDESRS
jgi:hypothetical protein